MSAPGRSAPGRPLRLALLTLHGAASAEAVLAFARTQTGEGQAGRIVLLGLSDPYRPGVGGATGQAWRHLRRSGPRMLGYLLVNMTVPRLVSALPGRGGGALASLCRARGIPAVTVADVNGATFHAALRAAAPDLIVTFHFDQILTPETIALAPLGGINLHPSLLPRHRGPVPAFWALADGEEAGVTVHRLAPRIDAGAILAQAAVPLPDGTTASAAARRLHLAGVPMLNEAVAAVAAGRAAGRETPILPYRPFPGAAALRAARRRGVRLVGRGDLRAALAAGL